MSDEAVFAYAKINARVAPMDRGDLYEDPLAEALAEKGFAEITGGGTSQNEDGEVNYCGIDLDLHDPDQAIPFICDFLAAQGAPKGSVLQLTLDGEKQEIPFGFLEGIAIYLNGTDLPDEVYEDCDINDLYDELDAALGEDGAIQGHWQGPTETALYLYGYGADEMRTLIDPIVSVHPLCQLARFEVIA